MEDIREKDVEKIKTEEKKEPKTMSEEAHQDIPIRGVRKPPELQITSRRLTQ